MANECVRVMRWSLESTCSCHCKADNLGCEVYDVAEALEVGRFWVVCGDGLVAIISGTRLDDINMLIY